MPSCSYLCCSFYLELQYHPFQLYLSACLILPPPSRVMTSRNPWSPPPQPTLLCSPRVTRTWHSPYCAETLSQQDCRLKALIGSHSCCIPNTEQIGWQRTEQCWLNSRDSIKSCPPYPKDSSSPVLVSVTGPSSAVAFPQSERQSYQGRL